jgi:Cof subfamily protein (haloacid dehalogenase superfamily)
MKYPLLATDLDGTLFNDQKEIDSETVQAIQEYRLKGGKVIICSGRSPLSTKWIANAIGLKGEPIIAYNGAIILDEKGQVKEQSVFQLETLMTFWEICDAEGIYAHLYEGDTLLIPRVNKWNENWIENNIPRLERTGAEIKTCESLRQECKVKIIDNFYQYLKTNRPKITKIAVFHDGDILRDFSNRIVSQVEALEISSSLNYLNLEISPSGVTKASALLKLTERLEVSISQTAAIGDNFNDSFMLKTVGLGIAMGNAPEEVKQIADKVTRNNNEAGVAYAIHRYLLS